MARALIADNCPDTARSCALLLRLWGHEVETACDGPSALAAALAHRPDVILTDVALRHLDGLELARRLRQDPHLKDVLLVAATGLDGESYRQAARAAGFDFFLVKPVEGDLLRTLLTTGRDEPLPLWAAPCLHDLVPFAIDRLR